MSIFVETKTIINVHGVLIELTKDQVGELYDLLGKELGINQQSQYDIGKLINRSVQFGNNNVLPRTSTSSDLTY